MNARIAKPGITVIEMLVVVAICSILTAVAIPVCFQLGARSKEARILNIIEEIREHAMLVTLLKFFVIC